jgi:hypothetical protein
MANTVIALKKSSTPSATPVALANGELAINYADGKLFYKAANGTIVEFASGTNSFGTVNANGTFVVADTTSDILSLLAGNNITIVGDAINDRITIGLTNDVVIPGTFKISTVGNDEGGELVLGNAVTNSVLAGDVKIDVYQNKLRFFESGSPNRGAFINLASASIGVGTDLLSGASGTDTAARASASAAYDKANAANVLAFNALPNTTGATFNGNLIVSQDLTSDRVITLNNGNGENLKVGDDAWIGDTNLANALRIKGQQNASIGYVMFGSNDGKLLGRAGTDNLTYDGNLVWHAGIDGAGSGLDADLLDGQHGTYYATATATDAAFDKANSANVIAVAAFNAANNAVTDFSPAYNAANAAFNKANSANLLAYNTGIGANAFASATIAGANVAVGLGANTYADQTFVKLTSPTQTITGNVDIVGNLTLSGNTFVIEATQIQVDDPLLYLAANNYTSDIVDIGFIANYVNTTGANVHTGLYREHTDKMYYLFQGYDAEPINNHIGALSNNMTLAVLNADIRTSNLVLGGANAIVTIGATFEHSNAAYATANVGLVQANTARDIANAAFDKANTSGGSAYYSGNNGDVGNATGLGDIFRVHTNTLTANVTIYSGNNALAAGPITVAVGKTLTIQVNARVAIV